MKVSELELHDIESMVTMLYDQYNMHVGRKADDELRNSTIESMIKYVSENKHKLSVEHIEAVFNVAVFESKHVMTYAMFIERIKSFFGSKTDENTSKKKSNTSYYDLANSEENKRAVYESLRSGIVNKKALYSYDEYIQVNPDFKRKWDQLKLDASRKFKSNRL